MLQCDLQFYGSKQSNSSSERFFWLSGQLLLYLACRHTKQFAPNGTELTAFIEHQDQFDEYLPEQTSLIIYKPAVFAVIIVPSKGSNCNKTVFSCFLIAVSLIIVKDIF